MTLTMPFPIASRLSPLTPLLFARPNRELRDDDFDDEYGGVEYRSRRPRRRPFFTLMLILLLVAGVWYVSTDPDTRSSVITRATMAIGDTLHLEFDDLSFLFGNRSDSGSGSSSGSSSELFPVSQVAPVPVFGEGQQVAVTLHGTSRVRLQVSHDLEEPPRGHWVNTDDVLTITDGRLVNQQWVYNVRTPSGTSGWIQEASLRAHF